MLVTIDNTGQEEEKRLDEEWGADGQITKLMGSNMELLKTSRRVTTGEPAGEGSVGRPRYYVSRAVVFVSMGRRSRGVGECTYVSETQESNADGTGRGQVESMQRF